MEAAGMTERNSPPLVPGSSIRQWRGEERAQIVAWKKLYFHGRPLFMGVKGQGRFRRRRRRGSGRHCQEETEGQRGGPAERRESKPMPERRPDRLSPGWLHPYDRPLNRDRPVGRVKGDVHRRAQRKDLGKKEQQTAPTDISRQAMDGLSPGPCRRARDRDLQRHPNPGVPHLSLGVDQVTQGPELIGE